MAEFDSVVLTIHAPIWYIGIVVPAKYAKPYITENSRVLCSVNSNEAFHGALMPKGDGDYFINLNKERRKAYSLEIGDRLSVSLEKDNSKYGMPLPAEFEELLYQDPEGNEVFHSLTMGKQRSLLYIIAKPKSEHKRLEKGIVVLDYLKKAQGKLDFKKLNQAFKEANRKA